LLTIFHLCSCKIWFYSFIVSCLVLEWWYWQLHEMNWRMFLPLFFSWKRLSVTVFFVLFRHLVELSYKYFFFWIFKLSFFSGSLIINNVLVVFGDFWIIDLLYLSCWIYAYTIFMFPYLLNLCSVLKSPVSLLILVL
jgi:hypothetical protein